MPPGWTSGPKLVTLGLLDVFEALSDESPLLLVALESPFVPVGFSDSSFLPVDFADSLGGSVVWGALSSFAEVLSPCAELLSSSGLG